MNDTNSKINERIKSVRKWVNHQISVIDSYDYVAHRLILICSLIDAFAQNDSGYQRANNQEHFTTFLEKYSSKYKGILSEVCPVTLYYHCFNNSSVYLQLRENSIFSAGDSALIQEATRLIGLLPEDQREQKANKHTYGALIYAMRNKWVHEMNNINSPFNYQQDEKEQIPHLVSEYKKENGRLVFKKWSLHIPSAFVFNVAKEVINGYLDHCESDGLDPFYNNDYERSCYYGWY